MFYEQTIIDNTAHYVRLALEGDSSGHDWGHTFRVYNNSLTINRSENADHLVISLAALLHDIADYKLHDGDCDIGPRTAHVWLEKQGLDHERIVHVCRIIKNISFKGEGTPSSMETLEGKIVQDSDRLDAIGAIGIARVFAFGGNKGREIYNPDVKPIYHGNFDSYKNSNSSSINHFYEKLLLLKDLMNTETAKKIAVDRHSFMLMFLDRFFKEWDGE